MSAFTVALPDAGSLPSTLGMLVRSLKGMVVTIEPADPDVHAPLEAEIVGFIEGRAQHFILCHPYWGERVLREVEHHVPLELVSGITVH